MHDSVSANLSPPQYYYDASEAEAWMSEQELYMMGEERAKDEIGAQNMMKKHTALENVVEDYAGVVRQLGERSRALINQEHPERCVWYNCACCWCYRVFCWCLL
ncbi:hypothetical protein DPMN_099608 [Dreissena polymorpha]|uniref:Uncharacterized protein n=1 Tax=Dreissena polymorpha TaxID=45954 RepID=A0A9D4R6L3_DREPO|nr:hypothetical protein DPMN_099608 [Dreissena polymorpha]